MWHEDWEISWRHQKFPIFLFTRRFCLARGDGKKKNRWNGELNEPHILSLRKEIMFHCFSPTHTSAASFFSRSPRFVILPSFSKLRTQSYHDVEEENFFDYNFIVFFFPFSVLEVFFVRKLNSSTADIYDFGNSFSPVYQNLWTKLKKFTVSTLHCCEKLLLRYRNE